MSILNDQQQFQVTTEQNEVVLKLENNTKNVINKKEQKNKTLKNNFRSHLKDDLIFRKGENLISSYQFKTAACKISSI